MNTFNKAIKHFGVDKILSTIHGFYSDNPDTPIVSVGSGLAQIEFEAKQKMPSIEWICVDPNPMSFNNYVCVPFIEPHYRMTNNLINERPNLIGNCCLFLNWCEPNESTYDFEAIRVLKPKGILAIFEQLGAAGGEKFHEWLETQSSYKEVLRLNEQFEHWIGTCYLVTSWLTLTI